MPYNEGLSERIRAALEPVDDVREQKMFGGIAFMVRDKMCVGVTNDNLMVRLGTQGSDAALRRPHTRPMDFTGRPMRGFVFVGLEGLRTRRQLQSWVDLALAYRDTLD